MDIDFDIEVAGADVLVFNVEVEASSAIHKVGILALFFNKVLSGFTQLNSCTMSSRRVESTSKTLKLFWMSSSSNMSSSRDNGRVVHFPSLDSLSSSCCFFSLGACGCCFSRFTGALHGFMYFSSSGLCTGFPHPRKLKSKSLNIAESLLPGILPKIE